MVRALKVILASVSVLVTLAAAATSAQAIAEFHCSVEPCRLTARPDGTGSAAHHVLVFEHGFTESLSMTCSQLTGEASFPKSTAFEFTLTNLAYDSCTVNGTPGVTFSSNGCDYKFSVALVGEAVRGFLTISCPIGKSIEFVIPTGCVITVPPQGPIEGVGFHTVEEGGASLIRAQMSLKGISATFDGTLGQCGIAPGSAEGTYTTGNTLYTGETTGGVMASAWYA